MKVAHHVFISFTEGTLSLPLINKGGVIVGELLLLLRVQVEVVVDVDHQAGKECIDDVEQGCCSTEDFDKN